VKSTMGTRAPKTGSRMVPLRFWLASATLVTVAVVGCGASSTEQATESSQPIIRYCPPGEHWDCHCTTRFCPDICGCVQDQCKVNPTCRATPRQTPGFDDLVLVSNSHEGIEMDYTFSETLANAGCQPTGDLNGEPRELHGYNPDTSHLNSDGYVWALASCPNTFSIPTADLATGTAGFLPCDSCTGEPGEGRAIVAWLAQGPCALLSDGGTGECMAPGGACTTDTCLVERQAAASDTDAAAGQ
jgi:hypothetical protein